MTFYYDNQVPCKVSKISKGNFTQFDSFHKGGLISENVSLWSFPQKNVPNHYLQLSKLLSEKVEYRDLAHLLQETI